LNLDFSDGENKREIKVFNAFGQLGILSNKTKNASTQINLKALNVIGFF